MPMNTSKDKPALKLGKRLQAISSMVGSDYSHIWDCCCDHGLLGQSLLSQERADTIHFVDIVPDIMATLSTHLEQQYPPKEIPGKQTKWKTHCIDVSTLPLTKFSGRHLIVIAGVGGDLMLRFIDNIVQKHRSQQTSKRNPIDFILCPVYHQFMLRQALIGLDLKLINERLIQERKQFYEVLYVSTDTKLKQEIHPAGEFIWQADTPEGLKNAERYLQKTLAHYQRRSLKETENEVPALRAYQAICVAMDKDGHTQ
jgi:tRNA (adenine22-N1)-methyltransferase